MKTRKELIQTIKDSKKAKTVSLIAVVIALASYFFFDNKQQKAEYELMVLDQGKIDETVLE